MGIWNCLSDLVRFKEINGFNLMELGYWKSMACSGKQLLKLSPEVLWNEGSIDDTALGEQ